MTAPQFTGSDEELADLVDAVGDEVDAQWRDNATFKLLETAPFLAWRDAAVARHLAEAGAVHPAVHTPTRFTIYLEQHGWKRMDSQPLPGFLRWIHACGVEVDMPAFGGQPDYAEGARVAVNRIAWVVTGKPFSAPPEVRTDVLLEIASMPEELPW